MVQSLTKINSAALCAGSSILLDHAVWASAPSLHQSWQSLPHSGHIPPLYTLRGHLPVAKPIVGMLSSRALQTPRRRRGVNDATG